MRFALLIGIACAMISTSSLASTKERRFQWKTAEGMTVARLVAEGFELKATLSDELYFQKGTSLFRCIDKTLIIQILECQTPVEPYKAEQVK